ncbi:MAG TPA: phytoene/squalene synthase family protein [Polyangiaceae bacterium]|nr:phytoene/squalene synthase family protein [Polyangiaceae bacterium]
MNSAPLTAPGRLELPESAAIICARTLEEHSKSFALAGKLLPAQHRRDAAVLYTYCRLADDSIDLVAPEAQPAALRDLQRELDSVYRGEAQRDVRLRAFQELVQRLGLPREYPEQLLLGMRMDTEGTHYQTLNELLLYCHRVAGVVGLMMCHVLGLSDARALKNAAHLGIAMQLTNICRDVAEDWQRGRLYLPLQMLRECGSGALRGLSMGPLPHAARESVATVTRQLLAEAERFYRSGDAGIPALPFRAGFSVRAARLIYAAIGRRILRQDYDAHSMRAVVPRSSKLRLLIAAALLTVWELPRRWRMSRERATLDSVLRFPNDILPV